MTENKLSMKGKVIEVLAERSGSTPKGTYKVQEYVIEETEGQYPHKLCFEVYGEDKIKSFNIQKGEVIEVFYNLDAREWNGRWFNSIKAWRVNHFGNNPAPTYVDVPKTNQQPKQEAQEPKIKNEDELPF